MKKGKNVLFCCLLLACMATPVKGQQTTFEKLNRGTVAVKTADGVLVSWRSLITDDDDLAFNVYRDGVKVNAEPITRSTNFVDGEGTTESRYLVKLVLDGVETDDPTSPTVDVWPDIYKRIHLQRPEKGEKGGTYTPNDCSVGDVDGDGDYELIVKWDPTNSHDNSENGYTDKVYLDCYEMEGGDYKWRIDLGRNIRAGAHYTQFMVYDLDGDGKAEVACKTAPGTVDGQGKHVLMGDDDPNADYRNSKGQVITGSEYLTVFNGETGAEITTVAYTPARGKASDWGKDSYGGRSERYLACIAYLDGNKPSLVMCRGYYQRTALAAYDFDGSNLTLKWLLDDKTSGSNSAYGQGNHNLSVGDVDGDGRDEIVYGACCIDDNGKLLYRTGLGHGDAMHLGDLDPGRPGLELFCVHEETSAAYGYEMHDAGTGEIIHGVKTGTDVGRGLAADIDASHYGYEMWAQSSGVLDCKGNTVPGSRPSVNFRIYWDGDLQDELLDGRDGATKPSVTTENKAVIQKWNGSKAETLRDLLPFGVTFCNTTKGTPNLVADLIGDWREEVIAWDYNTCSDLLLFTTDIPTEHKVTTLMHDHVYRMGIAWQNVAYNQPPHLGYFLPETDHVTAIFYGSGSTTQSIELGASIEPISYAWRNAEGVELTGELPEGVTFSADTENKQFTIEGTPAVTGTFAFEVNTTGGETTATLSGTITVKPEAVLTELAYFPFDEASGTVAANRVYGQAEAVNFTPTWTEGVLGQALELPAAPTDRRMQQASYESLELATKSFTVECWFRSNGGNGVDWYLLHKGTHAGKWFGIQYKNGNLTFAADDGLNKTNLDIPATSYFDGEWHHLVCVRDRSNRVLKMYIDAVSQGEIHDMTNSISETENLVIGNCNINFNTPFAGAIDELHIYEGAMSAKRVAERYNDPNVSGISSVKANGDGFVVYPALFTDEIAIQCPAEAYGRCTMTIYSATDGRAVHQGIYNVDGGSVVYVRGLDGLAAGSYVLSIENGTERIVRKLLKANR